MRHSLRLVASTILGAGILLTIGVGSTFAKPTIEKYDLGDAWCFQDVIEMYCTVEKGTFTIETKDDGSSIGRMNLTTKVEVTAGGIFVARYTTKSHQETRSDADGSYTFSSRDRTKWTDGEQKCTSDIRLKIVDFEVVIDSTKGHCN